MKKFFIFFLTLCILFVAILSVGFFYIKNNSASVLQNKKGELNNSELSIIEFEVQKGMTAKSVGKELQKLGLIKDENVFYIFARFPKVAEFFTKKDKGIFKIQTGYYQLNQCMDLGEIFAELSTGKEKSIIVSIPEGLTISKIAGRLKNAGLKNIDDFEQVALYDGKKIFASHNLNIDADSVEGFLFPDTYSIPINYNSEKVIGLMIDNLVKNISLYSKEAGVETVFHKDFYKTMILASIVEREYRVKEEAASIAGVFTNRLKINMPLQSCATVEYIITEINHKPHPKIIYFNDLEIKNPFNTYKYAGLPPSPICNPGMTAIKAAITPEKNNYLYFTLTDANAGRHTFSKNLDAHINATNEFRTKRDANN